MAYNPLSLRGMEKAGREGSGTDNPLQGALKAAEAANVANEQRYAQAMAIYDEIISRYQPGGGFEQKALGEIEKTKTRDVGQSYSGMISSGLSGVTTASTLGTSWESSVGAGKRLALEDLMMERLSGAQQQKAGFIERREDVGPSYGEMMNIAQQGAGGGARPQFQSIISGGGDVGQTRGPAGTGWDSDSSKRDKGIQEKIDAYLTSKAAPGQSEETKRLYDVEIGKLQGTLSSSPTDEEIRQYQPPGGSAGTKIYGKGTAGW